MKNIMSSARMRSLQDGFLCVSICAAFGAFFGFGFEDVAQHFEKIGVAATLFGAQLGLLGYDWLPMALAALYGAGAGAALGVAWLATDYARSAARRRKLARRA
jgi:hypothetical protein